MILGTHNSMAYGNPRKWWMKIFAPFSVCQTKTIDEQLAEGVRCFDLRVRLQRSKSGEWTFAHGLYETCQPVLSTICYLGDWARTHHEPLYIRIILERKKYDGYETQKFYRLCRWMLDKYSGRLVCFEGRRKGGWKEIFPYTVKISVWQPVSSVAEDARWYEKVLPKVYARRKNAENREKAGYGNEDVALFDFV